MISKDKVLHVASEFNSMKTLKYFLPRFLLGAFAFAGFECMRTQSIANTFNAFFNFSIACALVAIFFMVISWLIKSKLNSK